MHPEDQQRVLDAAMADDAGGCYQQECRILLPDGSCRWIRDQCFALSSPWEGAACVAGIAEDITALHAK